MPRRSPSPAGTALEDRVVRLLAEAPLDYLEQLKFIDSERKKGEAWGPAAVLVLLVKYPGQTRTAARSAGQNEDGYFFLLNKRSALVQQPGDLCFPGGHPNRGIDFILGRLIVPLVFSIKNAPGFQMLKKRDNETFRRIIYFLGNGLREAFEEIRLNPFRVDFLGALRCYQLELFQRVIFPLVGLVGPNLKTKLNWEVDRIVRIPLSSLMIPENYAIYRLKVSDRFKSVYQADRVDYECFVHREANRPDEILWGASYRIVQSFLNTVFDFHPPPPQCLPIVEGELYPSIV
jgi:8-oxo-dGTP pyrophosphatase MutT (NUDIX family)